MFLQLFVDYLGTYESIDNALIGHGNDVVGDLPCLGGLDEGDDELVGFVAFGTGAGR